MASADPAPPHTATMPTTGTTALPPELLVIIGQHAKTQTLATISRTSHALHALLARELQTRYDTDILYIILWSCKTHRAAVLHRALTTALAADTPVVEVNRGPLRILLGMCLGHLLRRTASHEYVQTAKVLIAHAITPTDPEATDFPAFQLSGGGSFKSIKRGPAETPAWILRSTAGATWVEYAIHRGDLGLAQWLLDKGGAQACWTPVATEWVGTEGENGTLLDVAKRRRDGDPGGENAEEMVQLLQDRCP
ncbi:hypothetical protein DFP73DRAFT_561497 [Morchella snyderi]|nr:hypothetical protein DFP73DRAFT_561497 [Morchella snyderi]